MHQPTDRHDPYDADRPLLMRCHCGAQHGEAEHAAATLRARSETAEFEAAIASVLPVGALTSLQAMAQDGKAGALALKHKDKRDPQGWKGFKFAVPFEYSMHNFCCGTTWPRPG